MPLRQFKDTPPAGTNAAAISLPRQKIYPLELQDTLFFYHANRIRLWLYWSQIKSGHDGSLVLRQDQGMLRIRPQAAARHGHEHMKL
ncbi:hypothetical protein ACWYXJ_07435 [Janthinobacterium lividum]